MNRPAMRAKHNATIRTGIELLNDPLEDRLGERLRPAANADEAVVKSIPVVRHATGGKPRGSGATTIRQQYPRHDDRQTKRDPAIHHGLKCSDQRPGAPINGTIARDVIGSKGFRRSRRCRLS